MGKVIMECKAIAISTVAGTAISDGTADIVIGRLQKHVERGLY